MVNKIEQDIISAIKKYDPQIDINKPLKGQIVPEKIGKFETTLREELAISMVNFYRTGEIGDKEFYSSNPKDTIPYIESYIKKTKLEDKLTQEILAFMEDEFENYDPEASLEQADSLENMHLVAELEYKHKLPNESLEKAILENSENLKTYKGATPMQGAKLIANYLRKIKPELKNY